MILYKAIYKEPDKLGLRKSEVIKQGYTNQYILRDLMEREGYTGMYKIVEYKKPIKTN